MSIKRRVEKLEGASESCIETPMIFAFFVDPQGGDAECSYAITGDGTFVRTDDETEGQFLMRVYASRCADKPIEHQTDEELEILVASQDEEAALSLRKTGSIPDDVLNTVINRLKQTASQARNQEQ
ncbi:hypothetical protein [Roseovarius sp. C03]|uniref:hypothetical protein n=1 Tax=Roseovarius sp. C03 TaxID=3449222 RepID=UPI003EDBC0FA